MQNIDAYRLKWIAVTGMFLNHVAMALREVVPFALQFPLYAAGGLTFPIMAFLAVEGYRRTSDLKKYLLRLLAFGLVAQVPYMAAFREYGFALNIMFTIALGILLLLLYDRMKTRILFGAIFALALVASMAFDWAVIGIIMMLLYRAIPGESKRRILPGVASGIFYAAFVGIAALNLHRMSSDPGAEELVAQFEASFMGMEMLLPALAFPVGMFAAAFLLKGYSGERGKPMKYFFYVFYPLHLAVLAGIALALGLADPSALGL